GAAPRPAAPGACPRAAGVAAAGAPAAGGANGPAGTSSAVVMVTSGSGRLFSPSQGVAAAMLPSSSSEAIIAYSLSRQRDAPLRGVTTSTVTTRISVWHVAGRRGRIEQGHRSGRERVSSAPTGPSRSGNGPDRRPAGGRGGLRRVVEFGCIEYESQAGWRVVFRRSPLGDGGRGRHFQYPDFRSPTPGFRLVQRVAAGLCAAVGGSGSGR